MENGIQYEIMSKATGECYLATQVAFGNGEVTVSTNEYGDVVFANNGGQLDNPNWLIRDAETKLAPNGVDRVEDVVPTPEATPEAAPETPAEETPADVPAETPAETPEAAA